MPPAKRTVSVNRGRPRLPQTVKEHRNQRTLGYVDNATWELIQNAAQQTGLSTKQFILQSAIQSASQLNKKKK